jgi:hypothetical protein
MPRLHHQKKYMITAIVEFKLPKPITVTEARETFLSTAPKYQGPRSNSKCNTFSVENLLHAQDVQPPKP